MKKLEYYSASWCGPCKMAKPMVEELQREGLNIEIIDIDNEQVLAAQKSIYSVPTFVLYDEGVEVGRASGVPSKSEIKDWLS